MATREINAASAGSWTGDMPVNRIGFGTKRLAGSSADIDRDAASDRDKGMAVLRRVIELGVNQSCRAPEGRPQGTGTEGKSGGT